MCTCSCVDYCRGWWAHFALGTPKASADDAKLARHNEGEQDGDQGGGGGPHLGLPHRVLPVFADAHGTPTNTPLDKDIQGPHPGHP